MKVSPVVKVAVAAGALLGMLAFLVIVDLGINAGRIHYGVSVEGVDVGGLTETDAAEILEQRGEQLKITPVTAVGDGFKCRFVPGRIGWGPQPFDTANAAHSIGRSGGAFHALQQRVRAWWGGISVKWADSADPGQLDRLIGRCRLKAAALGYQLDEAEMARRINEAIVAWPERSFEVPVAT